MSKEALEEPGWKLSETATCGRIECKTEWPAWECILCGASVCTSDGGPPDEDCGCLVLGGNEKPLFIPLKREFFEQFEKGHKTFEYRPYGPRWNERTCRIGRKVVLSLGYGKDRRLKGEIVSFEAAEGPTRTSAWRECYGDREIELAAKIEIKVERKRSA